MTFMGLLLRALRRFLTFTREGISLTNTITHFVVKEKPAPRPAPISIGRIFTPVPEDQGPEVVFRTVRREDDEKSFEDEAETKVVKARRGRRPKANEDAETK